MLDPMIRELEMLDYEQLTRGLPDLPTPPTPSVRAGEPITEAMLRDMLGFIDPTFGQDRDPWVAICGAVLDAPLATADRKPDEDADRWALLDDWCSGGLWRERTGDAGFHVSTYYGRDELESTLSGVGDGEEENPAGWGTVIHHARTGGYDGPMRLPPRELFEFRAAPAEGDDAGPLSAAELAAGNYLRVEHLWQSLLLKDHVNLLYGDGGTGKTLLALQVAVAVAAGKPLFGRAVRQMPALVVLAEDDYGETKYRLSKICADLGVELDELPLDIWCRPGRDSTLAVVRDTGEWHQGPFYPRLLERLYRLGGVCFCVLDTVSDVAFLDENKRPPVNTLCKVVLGGICREVGATILLNAHPSKASMEGGYYYAGSTAWNNSVRQRLVLERPDKAEKSGRRILRVAKSNYGTEGEVQLYYLGGTFHDWTVLQQDEQEAEEREAVLQVVLDLIGQGVYIVRGNGSGQKPKDVAKAVKERRAINLSPKRVLEHLNTLERHGDLTYEVADKNRRGHRAGFRKGSNA